MKGNLKLIMDSAGEIDLEEFTPSDNIFSLRILLGIGLGENFKMDYFELKVCSVDWIMKYELFPYLPRHTLILKSYNYNALLGMINHYIDICDGDSWLEISGKLSRYFYWEYEDYHLINTMNSNNL